ncbi:hypothetical protein SARC_06430 [Sphaeroforma arctica JP610]|uniref:Uncharacterized protein n=1 Tax=Sphaeroforma arctica JP610 TaxID=667725 RepID=A0A0L0FWP0_9EUKA|nr:hypothetical protein SARC_06430 [Sphaeroforma arctica JP610]KNC81255.1 hypothetical protein SARC_06430 [Sphaeroforma arctica JP610]|eukprot:XP_014155157.1 hypothetical protein SARC_06430 [Sphaeroforma arctica JP610]
MIQRMSPTANDARSMPIVFKLDSAGCYRGRISFPGYISKPTVLPEIRNPSTKPPLMFELLEQADPVFETALIHSAKVYVGERETEPRHLSPRVQVVPSDMKTFEAAICSITGEETVASIRVFGQVLHDSIDAVTRYFRDRFDFSEFCALLDVCRGDEQWVTIVDSLCDKSPGRKYDDALLRRMVQFVTRNDPNGFCKFINSASGDYIDRRVHVWATLLGLESDNPTKTDLIRAVKTRGPPVENDDSGETKIKIKRGKRRAGPRSVASLPVATDLTYNDEAFTLQFRGKLIKWTVQQFQRCTGATQMQMNLYQVPKSAMEAQKLMIGSLVKVSVEKHERTLSVSIHRNFDESAVEERHEALDRNVLVKMYDSAPGITCVWIPQPSRSVSRIQASVLNAKFPPLPPKTTKDTIKPYYERVDDEINYVSNGVTTTVAKSAHIGSMMGNLVRVSGKHACIFKVLEGAIKSRSVSRLRWAFETTVTQLDYVGVEWKSIGNFTVARKMANARIRQQLETGERKANYRLEVCNTASYEYFNAKNTVLDRPPENVLPESKYLAVPCLAYHDIDPKTLNAAGKNSNIRLLDHNVVRHNVYNVDAKFQRAKMNFLGGPNVTRLQLKPLKVPAPQDEGSHFQLRTAHILIPRDPHGCERGLKLKTTWKKVATDALVNKDLFEKQMGCEVRACKHTTNARRGTPGQDVVSETGGVIGRRRLPVAADFPNGRLPFKLSESHKLTSYTISVIDLVDRDSDSAVVKGLGVSDVGISTAHSIYDPDNKRFWEFGRGATGFLCDTLAKRVDKEKSAKNVSMARLFKRALRARVRRLHEVWLAATLALFSEFAYSFSTTAAWMKSELSKRTHRRAGILSLCRFHDKLTRATSSPKSSCTLVDLGDEKYTTSRKKLVPNDLINEGGLGELNAMTLLR